MQKESKVLEGHLRADHVHMLVSIPPKCAVSQVVVFIKGKSAIHIARSYAGRRKNFTGQHFWARGYYVSTVGADEEVIRQYIRRQEVEDRRLDQLQMFSWPPPLGGTQISTALSGSHISSLRLCRRHMTFNKTTLILKK